jgi:aldehyde:ferredoxin oxidoreductase
MSELYGYTGSILRVDLTRREVSTTETAKYLPDYVGGMGIAARIAWEELMPGVDALDPENMLFMMLGPLTGTLASGAGRVMVCGIAPQLKPSIFSRSGMGGYWGAELKFAGFDGIVIQGKADKPVYLWVHDGECEIKDAEDLWGSGTYGVTARLRDRHGRETRVAGIGQAGENLCRIACIQTETGNAAGQGGYGAVMGSKNLKCIAVRGTGGIKVADAERLLHLALDDPREGARPTLPVPDAGPRRQWRMPEGKARNRKCGFCATPCTNRLFMGIPGEASHGIYSAAMHCWGFSTSSLNAHIEGRATVADMGLNGWEISYGIIPWLQMCRQQGLINDIDGIEIPVPDKPIFALHESADVPGELLMKLLHMITYREGELGEALADGACYAGEKLFDGQGAHLLNNIYPRRWGETNHWNGHWGTGGQPWFPFWLVPIIQWCVDVRDPASDSTHQYTEHVLPYIPSHGPDKGPLTPEEAAYVCEQVYGDPRCWDPQYLYDEPDTKVLPAIFHHNRGMLVESLVLCDREHTRVFSSTSPDRKADTAVMSKLYSAVTGVEKSEADMDRVGERVFNLIRAIDIRNHDRSRAVDNAFAADLTQPSFVDGVALEMEKFMPMMDRYYERRGWNPANGYPTRAKLEQLGMGDVADGLEKIGKLG